MAAKMDQKNKLTAHECMYFVLFCLLQTRLYRVSPNFILIQIEKKKKKKEREREKKKRIRKFVLLSFFFVFFFADE